MLNKLVTIKSGKYTGLAGEVIAQDEEKKTVTVKVSGVLENVAIDKTLVFKRSQVEVFNG